MGEFWYNSTVTNMGRVDQTEVKDTNFYSLLNYGRKGRKVSVGPRICLPMYPCIPFDHPKFGFLAKALPEETHIHELNGRKPKGQELSRPFGGNLGHRGLKATITSLSGAVKLTRKNSVCSPSWSDIRIEFSKQNSSQSPKPFERLLQHSVWGILLESK